MQILRPYQQAACAAVWQAEEEFYNRVLICKPTGTGKCLAEGTPVMLSNGKIVPVEEIQVGDLLMGPDSQPRRVLSTTTGREMLYRVTPTKGDSYVVNESHILSLKITPCDQRSDNAYEKGHTVNISVRDYLAKSKTFKHRAKGWKPDGVDFNNKFNIENSPIWLDPYFLGVWLGDGHTSAPRVTTADPEIVEHLREYCQFMGVHFNKTAVCGKAFTYSFSGEKGLRNTILDSLRLFDLFGNKHIPHVYKTASKESRLALLAGLIDTDGSLTCGGYDYISKLRRLAEDVAFIARSVGLAAYVKPCMKTCSNNGVTAEYYRVSITGHIDRIPVRIPHKKANPRRQKKDVLVTGISVAPVGDGGYYGFEIDADGLFLLGDFTVTHNTTTLSEIVKEALSRNWDVLVTAHRSEIVAQLFERIRDHCGLDTLVDIGMEIDTVTAPGTARVICASVQSIIKPERIGSFKERCRLLIVDEAHHAAADTYKAIATQCGVDTCECFYVGCTATAKRGDKQSLYAQMPDGSPVKLKDKKGDEFEATAEHTVFEKLVFEYPMDVAINEGWIVEPKGHTVKSETDISKVKRTHGDFAQGELAKAVDNATRTLEAIQGWKDAKADDRPTIVFCASVEHAHHTKTLFEEAGYTAGVVDGTTDKLIRFNLFADFRAGRVQVLCNMGVATEGTDLVNCSCIIHLRPTQNWGLYLQMCVDMQTEILTEQGWRTPDTIQKDDRAAGFDMGTGAIQWNAIKDIINRPLSDADEAMYSFNSPSVDFRVTGGHQMIYRTRADRQKGLWRKTKAEDLSDRSDQYEIPVSGVQQSVGVPLSNDELRFIGWFLTDGTLSKANNSITICQAEHQPYHQAIRDCLEGCGFKYGVHRPNSASQFNRNSPLIRYTVSKGKPRGRDAHLKGWSELEPYINKDFSTNLEECTPAQLAVLLEAMNMGDGCKYHGKDWTQKTYRICTGRKVVADRLQSLCVRRGFRCNQSTHYFNQNPIHYLHIRPETARTVGGSKAKDRASLVPCVYDRSEHVWCLETEMGTIITRRNGKVTIMGNTGRGVRPNCVLKNEWKAQERLDAIAASPKKDCIVIDVVDITKGKDLCTVPSILDLPVKMDLQGAGVAEVQKMLKEFEEVKGQVIGECPVTYEALKVRLEAVELLRQSSARNVNDWAVTDTGYTFRGVRPGYSVQMDQTGENWHLSVKHRGNVLMEKTGKPGANFKDYLNSAQKHAKRVIDDHAAAQPQQSRGTLMRLTEKQCNVLRKNGYKNQDIDSMPYAKAKAIIGSIMDAWKLRQATSRVA